MGMYIGFQLYLCWKLKVGCSMLDVPLASQERPTKERVPKIFDTRSFEFVETRHGNNPLNYPNHIFHHPHARHCEGEAERSPKQPRQNIKNSVLGCFVALRAPRNDDVLYLGS